MRLLANENFPLDAVEALRAQGHDIIWIRTESPGIRDIEVLALARTENRILLTFDKDFGELAFHAKLPVGCGIVLFRISMPSSAEVAHFIVSVMNSRADWQGNFTVVEDSRIRIRALP